MPGPDGSGPKKIDTIKDGHPFDGAEQQGLRLTIRGGLGEDYVYRMHVWLVAARAAGCSCALICPCPVDSPPTGSDGECRGLAVFHIANGTSDDTDLSGRRLRIC
ncbi:MAG: hypothetical protein NVSMB43_18670 [Pseudarthrobacter sp.]